MYLFPLPGGKPYPVHVLRRELKSILVLLRKNHEDYNTHSFRIGAATEMFQRGLSVDIIKKLGRWKGEAHEIYERPDEEACALWARSITHRKLIPDLQHIRITFGDEYSNR